MPPSVPLENPHASAQTAIIGCEVLRDEVEEYLATLPGEAPLVHWLEQGLHNDPPRLKVALQDAINALEAQYPGLTTLVLVYGLCSRGSEGVRSRRCRLVMARAHDCITLLLGSRQRYAAYVKEHPGTYWYSRGWNTRHLAPGPERHAHLLADYTARYGEENAEYLMETEQHWFTAYNRATFIHLEPVADLTQKQYTENCAAWLGWQFDCQHGDSELLHTLLTGPWDDRFVVLAPGQSFKLVPDERVIEIDDNPEMKEPTK